MNEIKNAMNDVLSSVSMTDRMKQRVLHATKQEEKQHHISKKPAIIAIMAAIMILGSTTVIGAVNGGWLDEFTRWWTESGDGTSYQQRKYETTIDGVSIIMYCDRNQDYHFEFTNAKGVTPVYQEDTIELHIEKEEGSTFKLFIPGEDAFSEEAYAKMHGEPVDGSITKSKEFTYQVVNP